MKDVNNPFCNIHANKKEPQVNLHLGTTGNQLFAECKVVCWVQKKNTQQSRFFVECQKKHFAKNVSAES